MSMTKVILGAIIGLAVGVGCSSSASQSGSVNLEENTQRDRIELVQKYPGKQILECTTPSNEYKVYTGEKGFVDSYNEYGYYIIKTATHDIKMPAHACVLYSPKR